MWLRLLNALWSLSTVPPTRRTELYDGATLDQIWPVERPLPRFWWWEDEHNPQRGE